MFETVLPETIDGQNRQSPIASVQRTQSTLASHSAVPCGTNVKRMNANRAIRIAAQRTQGLWGLISLFWGGRYDRQRTLAIRIAAVTLASDSAITIARFRPSKRCAYSLVQSLGKQTHTGLDPVIGEVRVHSCPKGPNLEKFQDRLKFSISLEIFKIAWNFQSRPPEVPTKNRGLVGGSLENFKLAWKFQDLEIFQDLGP